MNSFSNRQGIRIIHELIRAVQHNKQYLSDIDGAIGDGDHGVNMNKGFTLCGVELEKNPGDLTHGLDLLSNILLMRIGGSMGPLYGKFFAAFADGTRGKDTIGAEDMRGIFLGMAASIRLLSTARPGDKTLIDALVPAIDVYQQNLDAGGTMVHALQAMKQAAQEGRDSTKEMVAQVGRAARLGERSKGCIDAGAASCCIIIETIADTISTLAEESVTTGAHILSWPLTDKEPQ